MTLTYKERLEQALLELARQLSCQEGQLSEKELLRLIRQQNTGIAAPDAPVKKRALLPYYLHQDELHPGIWQEKGISEALEARIKEQLRAKPRRTASGVATVTVIAKPWPCSGNCRYCPNDLRMPKSYLADEPACQRAEQSFFDPFLQVSGRLRVLRDMGHHTDKVELIVLGGTWTDYPAPYRAWFVRELFRALNCAGSPEERTLVAERRKRYLDAGFSADPADCQKRAADLQSQVDAGLLTYNEGWRRLWAEDEGWRELAHEQIAALEEVEAQQHINEHARCRCVGLSFETQPTAINAAALEELRRLGCTKVQVGVQSVDFERRSASDRPISDAVLEQAFGLLRLFGFKIHAHIMANLPGASPEKDKSDYLALVTDRAFEPDEVKLYPCALIRGTALERDHAKGLWQPYSREELLDVLAQDVLVTPPFVRISRMIRDFSAQDIVAGSREANLRQAVEDAVAAYSKAQGKPVQEIRMREIAGEQPSAGQLAMSTYEYETLVSCERFLSWTTHDGSIAGFLRLSLPQPQHAKAVLGAPDAMIREVHVYGRVSELGLQQPGAQHRGLGRSLVEEACRQAAKKGYPAIKVISAVGTREYYRGLGFKDAGLYQKKELQADCLLEVPKCPK